MTALRCFAHLQDAPDEQARIEAETAANVAALLKACANDDATTATAAIAAQPCSACMTLTLSEVLLAYLRAGGEDIDTLLDHLALIHLDEPE